MTPTIDNHNPIQLTTSITFEEYFKHLFPTQYKKSMILPIGILLTFYGVRNSKLFQDSSTPIILPSPFVVATFIIVVLIVIPLSIYIEAKRFYKTNRYISQKSNIIFTEKNIQVQGVNFTSEYVWEGLYKIEEKKDWLLFFTDKAQALRIQKKHFNTLQELENLKALIRTKSVKHILH